MTIRAAIMKIVQQSSVNFLLTNRIPRRLTTRAMGWLSRIENPVLCAVAVRVWGLFTELDLTDARETRFRSVRDVFTRRLKDGARPVDPDPAILVSPCDAIVGASGDVGNGQILQIKGMPYLLEDLLGDAHHAATFRGGLYVTLRLTSAMYHRFHAPHDCRVGSVTHVFGDAWNVNPAALARVERVFCRNERALIRLTLACGGHAVTLVPVAAILVAGIKLGFLEMSPDERRASRRSYACDVALTKGEEMGWFEHGSTILVFAPAGFAFCAGVRAGLRIRAGEALMHMPFGPADAARETIRGATSYPRLPTR